MMILFSCAQNPEHNNREYQVGAYLWFQHSGEYQALCYQAYNLAQMRLQKDLEEKHNRKRAVVFDIDETVFDNSFGGAYELKHHIDYDKDSFNKWVHRSAALAVPGAIDFINFAEKNRVEVIFITNRPVDQIEDTFLNFKKLNIPFKKENFYFLTDDWSKESRRLEVLKKYDVVLYFGDNLHDFHKDWDNKSSDERRALTVAHQHDFGEKFIVLPNPLYGDWENALPKSENREDLLKTIP